METVISVENLSKTYRLGQIGTGTFSRDLEVWWAKLRGKPNPMIRIGEQDHGNRDGEELWALHNVSFTVEQGEVLGIIGRNGAGKSTLLKILSRVTAPTSGRIRVRGRVASLLEVGTGFHPELTGRENIYLNGAILGMTKQEVMRKFDEIVDFAGVEKFIDTPVKRYSSGMYVRLAFAVAAHLEPEILLIDEVLAVGDTAFQQKCLGKMGEVARGGRTIIFVSHNMAAIRNLCSRSILVQSGKMKYSDESSKVIDYYLNEFHGIERNAIDTSKLKNRSGTGKGQITKVELISSGKQVQSIGIGEKFIIRLTYDLYQEFKELVFGVEIKTLDDFPLVNIRSDNQGLTFGPYKEGKNYYMDIVIPGLSFYPGNYSFVPWFAEARRERIDSLYEGLNLHLHSVGNYVSEGQIMKGRGVVLLDCEWKENPR